MDSQRKYKSENNAKKQIKIDENSGTYREWILTIIHFDKILDFSPLLANPGKLIQIFSEISDFRFSGKLIHTNFMSSYSVFLKYRVMN